ncbi:MULTISPECIES: class I SAM-dependent methyltransferase [Pseudofrankia]|uniref:class I SAM-dependent methyltransferase n=1 Tax=Pseudofrankia TaxID=2994363 RepID=UPI000234B1DE|nr:MULTISPECIES: class I SAM-dependent methyltransferase [Pseudofrankia]OHV36558.1 methyltransferase type 11 [Pseudofrankia sp. EUN1h]
MDGLGTFEELIEEGASVPVEGWDFSWFAGRATEERAPWGYAGTIAGRIGAVDSVLEVQTGGGEVFGWALGQAGRVPPRLAATESWPPNRRLARDRLRPRGVHVVGAADDGALPFVAGSFDLIVSRHPVVTGWSEISRVLRPGGSYLSQQIGAGSNRELIDFLMGPQPIGDARSSDRAVREAEAAGLVVVDLRQAALRATFNDVGAVVHFLRKVLWTIPGFTVDRYRDRLFALHERIRQDGPFVTHAQRFLVEARRPE